MWAALLPEMDSATARFWTQQKKAGVSMGSFIAAHIDILSMFAVERDLKVVAKANGDYASCVDEVRACLKAAEVCKVMFFAAVDIVGYSTFVDSIEEAANAVLLEGASTESHEDFQDRYPLQKRFSQTVKTRELATLFIVQTKSPPTV